jgi:hypothetical protein
MTGPNPSYDSVARFLVGQPDGRTLAIYGAYMTEWDPVTRWNVVSGGAQEFTDLPMINPTLLAVGPVLLLETPAAPIILGRIYTADPRT